MRNLKRVLSLALAMVMVLGVMIISSSAASKDFVDADKIDYVEAVDVLTGLGVLEGYSGSFNPDEILTREQAAKILCYIMLGEENANKLGANSQIFKDVAPTRWSAGYIAYCSNVGLIAGYNGNFDPEGQLTGVAFAKLLLVAAGYDAEAEGYVNTADWAMNVASAAIDTGIDVKGVILANPLTRQQMAQMVLNALEMNTVTYVKGTNLGLVGPWTVPNTSTSYTSTSDGIMQFCEKYYPGLSKTAGTDDVWGRPSVRAWTYANKTLHTVMATPVATYYTAKTDCEIAVELGLKSSVNTNIYVDGGNRTSTSVTPSYSNVTLNPLATTLAASRNGTGTGVLTEVYYMGTVGGVAQYRLVEINTYLAQVKSVATQLTDTAGHVIRDASITLDVYSSASPWSNLTFKTTGYNVGDYVLVRMLANGTVQSVDLATPAATATLSAYTVATTTVGTLYNDAVKFYLGNPNGTNLTNIGKTYNVYVDFYGNVIGLVVPNTIYNYGIITDIAWQQSWGLANEYILANVMTMNGTVASNVTIGNAWTNAGYSTGTFTSVTSASVGYNKSQNTDFYKHLFQFVVDSNGRYVATAVGSDAKVDSITTNNPYIVCNSGANRLIANDDTVYLVKTLVNGQPTYTSYTGYKTVPSMTFTGSAANACFVLNSTGAYVQYIYVDATAASFTGTSELAILFDDTADAWTGYLYGYNMWIGDQMVTKYVANAQTLAAVAGGAIVPTGTYQVTYDAAGNIIGMTQVTYGTTANTATLTATYCDGTVIRDAAGTAYNCTGMNVYVVHSVSGTVTAGTIADVANATTGVNNYMILNAAGQVTTTYVVVAN